MNLLTLKLSAQQIFEVIKFFAKVEQQIKKIKVFKSIDLDLKLRLRSYTCKILLSTKN